MVSGRTAIDAPVVLKLTKTLLDIVLSCEDDLAPQARWAAQLHRVLRLHRKKLLTQEFTVPWRPLYQMLRKKILEPSPLYEGTVYSACFLCCLFGFNVSSPSIYAWTS